MPRPREDGAAGTWSLRQAFRAAGVSQRAARDVAARGLIDPDAIIEPDILVLRVVVALDRCALLAAGDPVLARMRDEQAARLAREAWARAAPGAVLVATDADARLASTPAELASVLALHADRPVVLLPAGAWAGSLRGRQAA